MGASGRSSDAARRDAGPAPRLRPAAVRPIGPPMPLALVEAGDSGTRERATTSLQRSAGNAAVQRAYQAKLRELDRFRAKARRTLNVTDWYEVARRLSDLPDSDLDGYVEARMSLGERAHTRWAALARAPECDRVTRAVKKFDQEAARISEVYHAYESAVGTKPTPNWNQAADAIRIMSNDDILRRLHGLTWAQKMELRAASKGDARLAELIEKSEERRIAAVYAAYDRAASAEQWETAAQVLNGMSASDIETRIRSLSLEAYDALKRAAAVTAPAVAAVFTRIRPPGELQEVDYPVPEPKPEAELSDVLEQGRAFGGDPDVAAFALEVARAEAAASKPVTERKPPAPAASAEDKLKALDEHFWKTVSHPRFASTSRRRLKHGWMVGVRERLRGGHIQGPTEFGPKYPPKEAGDSKDAYKAKKAAHVETLEPKKVPIPGGGHGKVLPYVADFLHTLQKKWTAVACNTRKDTGTHGLGYGIDCTLTGAHGRLDSRGFYSPNSAVAFLNAVEEAANEQTPPLRWTALYNDAQVQHSFPSGRVGYQGKEGNWHGPLVLHFHIEVTPTAEIEF